MRRVIAAYALYPGLLLLLCCSTGCWLTKPKDDFGGVVKNAMDLRVYAWNPGKHAEVHQLDPNDQFSCYLKGSEVYEFKAWLHDSSVVSDFTARINQVSNDAQVNDSNVDWVWVIGGPFMACTTPSGGEQLERQQATVELIGSSGAGQGPPSVVYVSEAALARVRGANGRLELLRTLESIQSSGAGCGFQPRR